MIQHEQTSKPSLHQAPTKEMQELGQPVVILQPINPPEVWQPARNSRPWPIPQRITKHHKN